MSELYYTQPTQEIFDEVKAKAIVVWSRYDNEFGYVDEKVSHLAELENISDNMMSIVGMFDSNNQRLLASLLSSEARKAIRDRLIDGGTTADYIYF